MALEESSNNNSSGLIEQAKKEFNLGNYENAEKIANQVLSNPQISYKDSKVAEYIIKQLEAKIAEIYNPKLTEPSKDIEALRLGIPASYAASRISRGGNYPKARYSK